MDYDDMSAKELQDECARRGLASARAAKPVMVQRLLDDDAARAGQNGEPFDEGGVLRPVVTEAVNDSGTPEPVLPAPAPVTELAAPGAFRLDFPAEPGGPDEETHLAYRTATLQAAADAGWQTRGDARLAATTDGRWVYEVSARSLR